MQTPIAYKKLLEAINGSIHDGFDGHCQVMSGVLSEALYFFQYGLLFNDQAAMDRAYRIVNYHVETATKYVLNYKFSHGLPGLSWLLCFLKNHGLVDKTALQNFDEVDAVIRESLKWDFAYQSYDYTVGMLGKAQYFLERELTEENQRALEAIVDQLEKDAVWAGAHACAWLDHYTSAHNKAPRSIVPFYNLGLGHGMASIIYFLCKFYLRGIRKEKCQRLITASMAWLQEREDQANWPNIYPNIIYCGDDAGQDKYLIQGWCHGLLSNGMAFLYAGRTLNHQPYLDKFNQIVEASVQIRCERLSSNYTELRLTNGAQIGLGLCHGVVGMMYFYDKLHQVTGNRQSAAMSQYWTNLMLYEILPNISLDAFYKHGILGGAPGLGMALMQKLDNAERSFNWDKIFLLDIENFKHE